MVRWRWRHRHPKAPTFNVSDLLRRSAFYLIALAWVVHTTGLVFRMYLEGRPPVTNLYSSAIFIGWAAVILGMVLEKIYCDGIGCVVASFAGFVTLIIAHNLALSGDTMEMMRAVLDTNFWLATHVVTVTLGYASTFVAGFLAIIYILRGVFTTTLSAETARSLARMVYGIVCFATLFSFVGTVLGGIWADQSWGRFWGWDPKENGALLIVLWNATILHARWGGLVRERGLMNLAVFGNIVTSFSWFGVNMLGIGLHSYGFTDAAFKWLILFIGTQVATSPAFRLVGLCRPVGRPGLDPGALGSSEACGRLLCVGLVAHVVCFQAIVLSRIGLVSWCCGNMRPKNEACSDLAAGNLAGEFQDRIHYRSRAGSRRASDTLSLQTVESQSFHAVPRPN